MRKENYFEFQMQNQNAFFTSIILDFIEKSQLELKDKRKEKRGNKHA